MNQLVNNPKNNLIARCSNLVKDKIKGRSNREEFYLSVDRLKREVDGQISLGIGTKRTPAQITQEAVNG